MKDNYDPEAWKAWGNNQEREQPMTILVKDQIACVRRELALRKNVYPGFVKKGRMTQEAADREIAAMQAVHDSICTTWVDVTLQPVPKDEKMYRVRSRNDRGVAWWSKADEHYGVIAEGTELNTSNVTHWSKFDGGDQL